MTAEPGTLYVVATPIGNLGDISARALQVLGSVGQVAAEDTRRSGQLLRHFGIQVPLVSLHEHNERERVPGLIAALARGESLALISDAGTPLLSDPGFQLVRAAREHAVPVVPVPGACSVIAALSAAGLPTDRFVFEGFLPARPAARRARLVELATEARTLVLFESSHRIEGTLEAMLDVYGPQRQVVVARELTKLHEQIHGAPIAELLAWLRAAPERSRGEFVVLVHGAPESAPSAQEARRLLLALLEELPPTRAAAVVARLTGMRRNEVYALALELAGSE